MSVETRAEAPDLTVVVASISRPPVLRRCLQTLLPILEAADAEARVVVVRVADPIGSRSGEDGSGSAACGGVDLSELQGAQRVEWLWADEGSDVFRLRSLGARAATGRLVALIEDHVVPVENWCRALLQAHRRGEQVVGGPVAPAAGVDFALYAVEYGHHAPPGSAGPTRALSGVNVAYDRELLERYRHLWRVELREDEINDAILAEGGGLRFEPSAVVESGLEMSRSAAAVHLYEGGRHFGHRRARQASAGRRLFLLLAAPLVPAVLAYRLAGRLMKVPGGRRRFVCHLPALLGLLVAWSTGEAVGMLTSMLGHSRGTA